MLNIPKHLTSLISFVILCGLVIFITPITPGLSKYKIASGDISVFPASQNVLEGRFISTPSARALGWIRYGKPQQPHKFHIGFDEDIFENKSAAIYIPSTAQKTFLSVNGAPSGRSSSSEFFAPGLGDAHLYYAIPKHALHPGSNRAHIHYADDRLKTGMRAIYLGPNDILERVRNRQLLWQKLLPPIGGAASLILLIMTFTGLIFSEQKIIYVWVGCILSVSFFQFLMSYLLSVPPFIGLGPFLRFGIPVTLLGSLFGLFLGLRRTKGHLDDVEAGFYCFAVLGPLLAIVHFLFPVNWGAPLYTSSLILVSALPFAVLWLSKNLYTELTSHRSRLAILKEQVSEQAYELDEKSKIIAGQMQDRAILEERQRFTRDIHDGIGGQLVSLLLRAKRGKIGVKGMVDELQSGVNDLRLIVDSMDHVGDDLSSALVSLRARVTRQLEAAQVKIDWIQSPQLNLEFSSPRGVLNLYRFVQEAVTNIARHADAKSAQISIEQNDAEAPVIVMIKDDGVGLDGPDGEKTGKGLENLRQRAQLLGGELAFQEGLNDKGFGIKLIIPAQA